MEKNVSDKKLKGWLALSPLLVFLVVYLVSSLVAKDFYKVPVASAFLIASVYALFLTKGTMEERIGIFSRAMSAWVNKAFYPAAVSDKGYTVTDSCIGCGKCEKLCPLNNISMENGRPVWQGNCTQCMACICRCPAEAIEYGRKTRGKRRYHLD